MGIFKSILKKLFPDTVEEQIHEHEKQIVAPPAQTSIERTVATTVADIHASEPGRDSSTAQTSANPTTTQTPTKPKEPFRLPAASSPTATRVTIGLDFGTAGTKVVVNLEDLAVNGANYFVVSVDDFDGHTSLITPSAITIQRGNIVIGHQAEAVADNSVVRSFKMCIPCLGNSDPLHRCRRCTPGHPGHFQLGTHLIDVVDLSTLYLAIVLFRTKRRLKEHLGNRLLKLRLNSAAPLDQMTSTADLRGPFERVLYRAWRLSEEVEEPWKIDSAIDALERIKALAIPGADESPTLLIPETHAAMTAYILAPERGNGLYATVDIGAGTTDVAFFWCGREDGVRKAWYYAAKSEFIGVDDVDYALADFVGDDLGVGRRKREAFNKEAFANAEESLRPMLDRLYRHYRKTFGQAYGVAMDERQWVELVPIHTVVDRSIIVGKWGHKQGTEYAGRTKDCRLAKYVLCLVGGGAHVDPIEAVLSRPLDSLRFDDVKVEIPGLPGTLRMLQPKGRSIVPPKECERQVPLLLLAYGLAHRAVDIPEWQSGRGMNREIRYRHQDTHEEIYG